MENKTAVFRFYASSWRGAGHALRSGVVADALKDKGWRCLCATESESYEMVPALSRFERIEPDEFYSHPFPHDVLIIDHYDCDESYESYFRDFAKVIVAIEDLSNRKRSCDILLDQSYGKTKEHYEGQVPSDCVLLTGPTYATLRPEFAVCRPDALRKRSSISSIENIMINFGGNDQKNMILKTLKELHRAEYEGGINVVYGMMAPHRAQVEEYAQSMPNKIDFNVNPNMCEMMMQADMAIGAPGVSAWERFCLGLPTLMVPTADNQMFTYEHMIKDGVSLGQCLEDISALNFVFNFDADIYRGHVERAASQTDGRGVTILIDEIERIMELKNGIRKKTA